MSKGKKRRFKVGLFYRFLLSYLAVVAILLGIISIIILDVFMRDFEAKAIANNTDKLLQLEAETDGQLFRLEHTLVTQIALDPSLTPFQLGLDGGRGYAITSVLNGYRIQNPAVFDIALYYGGSGVVYSGDGTYSLADYFTHHFVYGGVSPGTMARYLARLSRPRLLGDHPVAIDNGLHMSLLTYFYPVALSNQQTLTIVLFIDARQLGAAMTRFTESSPGYLLLYNDRGNELFSSASSLLSPISPETRARVGSLVRRLDFRAGKPTLVNVVLQDTRYTVTFVPSRSSGVVYSLVIPENEYTRDIRSVTNTFIAAIAAIFLLGFFLAVFFSRRTYAPFAELGKKLSHSTERLLRVAGNVDEIESIEAHVDRILEENKELSARHLQDQVYVREQLLLQLLNGQIAVDPAGTARLAREGIRLEGTGFIVLYLLLDTNEPAEGPPAELSMSEIITAMENEAGSFGHGYGVHLSEGNAAFIACLEGRDAEPCIEAFTQSLLRRLAERADLAPTIAVGEGCSRPSEIRRSYLQARTAALHRFRLGRNRIIHHRDIAPSRSMPTYIVLKNQGSIERLLRRGDYEGLKAACDQVFEEIGLNHFSIEVTVYLANSLLATVLRVVEELDLSLAPFLASINAKRILLVGQFETVEDFRLYLLKLCRFVTDQVTRRLEDTNAALAENIRAYVEKSFSSPEMSLKHLADVFGLSPSYISRLFRGATGATVMKCVEERRIALCKELLITTNLRLREIISQAGYGETNSFIRRFRQETGVTPMRFRAEHATGTVQVKP